LSLVAVQMAVAIHAAALEEVAAGFVGVHMVAVVVALILAYLHLLVAMMLGLDHSVYMHASMMHMGYGCFGLSGKHAHQGYCNDG